MSSTGIYVPPSYGISSPMDPRVSDSILRAYWPSYRVDSPLPPELMHLVFSYVCRVATKNDKHCVVADAFVMKSLALLTECRYCQIHISHRDEMDPEVFEWITVGPHVRRHKKIYALE
jgi:hypothetical protein